MSHVEPEMTHFRFQDLSTYMTMMFNNDSLVKDHFWRMNKMGENSFHK